MDNKVIIGVVAIIVIAIIIRAIYNKKRKNSRRNGEGILQTNRPTSTQRITTTSTSLAGNGITEIPGIVEYYANDRHNSPDKWFRFKFKIVNGNWRVYIIRMPDLRGRDSNLHLTHRYTDHNGNYWICWDGDVKTLKFAQDLARNWGDRLLEYINTGVEFKDQD